MAFHVACPITCRKICFCELGFPRELQSEKGRNGFLEEILRIEEFVRDPWLLKAEVNATVQVKVPKVAAVVPPSLPPPQVSEVGGDGNGDEAALAVSAQTKRVALQKEGAAASLVAEDFARRFETGETVSSVQDDTGDRKVQSNVKVMCRLCFNGENEGSERARKMLPCNMCGKKYHRICLKSWSQNRDLFHWSSWTCPSCRICEVCKRMGDPNKFMFCKRCDGAYHCYCQQPPHKNVSSGPYLCPKHTKCHSCGSTVPGNGLSVRWFHGYTCCDACGRLFMKGNYCPVCLKVYRDSEATPMVCCDVCQRWVHCQCDGISDDKYLQFQENGNLQYSCPTCRGECYQVRNLEDAIQELWRRRDEADKDLIASLRAAAGLPTQEDIFSISPFSDDEENDLVVLKNEGRPLKFSVKGLVDKSPKKNKDVKKLSSKTYGKKDYQSVLGSRAESHQSVERPEASSFGYNSFESRKLSSKSEEREIFLSPVAGNLNEGMCSTNQAGVQKHKFIDEVTASNGSRAPRSVKIKSTKFQGGLISGDGIGDQNDTSNTSKGRRLVIHIGSRNKNAAISPSSDVSSCQKDQDMSASNGSEDAGGPRFKELMDRQDSASKFGNTKASGLADQNKGSKLKGKEDSLLKIRNSGTEAIDLSPRIAGGKLTDISDKVSSLNTHSFLGKRSVDTSTTAGPVKNEVPVGRGNKWSAIMSASGRPVASVNRSVDNVQTSVSAKETKRLLKLKFKNPILENHTSWASKEEERVSVKGQRSKRKRPSPIRERAPTAVGDDAPQSYKDSTVDEFMDANWILQKLGKDAIGKRVEVHQTSSNTWNKGTVTEVFDGSTRIFVALDNGRAKNLELGKQGVRFISQKQKR